jgi:hypothetical protein
LRVALLVGVMLVCMARGAVLAQQRPLSTQDPETIGDGRILLEGGFEYRWDETFAASGLEGDRLRVPLLGISVGLGSRAELQIDGGFGRLAIEERFPAPLGGLVTADDDSTSSFEDIEVATKVRLLTETPSRPAFAVRFATRLPNASNESGLGLDTTDFLATVLVGKTVASIRVVGNAGLGILGDPTSATDQNDVLLYGLSFARALTDRAEVVGEINGHLHTREGDAPAGTESRGLLKVGARYTMGAGRIDGAILLGLTSREPQFGIGAGYTHVFDAFTP